MPVVPIVHGHREGDFKIDFYPAFCTGFRGDADRFGVFNIGSSAIVLLMSGRIRKSADLGESARLQDQPATPEIFISAHLTGELIRICRDALPHKAFGLVGGADIYHPTSLYPCFTNLRNTPEWRSIFESFGEFYRNPDLGFVISPPEVKVVIETMVSRRESFVGVFHSHRFLRAEPSEVDLALSSDPSLLCYIISIANPSAPEIGIFHLNGGGYQKIPMVKY
jgi:proteasome lid subunit RPN8/RPN11